MLCLCPLIRKAGDPVKILPSKFCRHYSADIILRRQNSADIILQRQNSADIILHQQKFCRIFRFFETLLEQH